MMEYIVVCLVALIVSGLTLFSGFGLGTLLMPAFSLFFPIPLAVAATASVHLANNLFKLFLLGRYADWGIVLRFAVPGAITAMLGAALLNLFSEIPPLISYSLYGQSHEISVIKLVIGSIIVGFALIELFPRLNQFTFDRKYLILGGIISGFFGGLSGNQGALRSAFLLKTGLNKEAFIGTGTVSAVIVDIARLLVYGLNFYTTQFNLIGSDIAQLVGVATLAAFFGSFFGTRLMKKITLHAIQITVGLMLIAVGIGMITGLF